MPESDSKRPSIRLAPLLGVNQRTAPNSTPAGEWETLEGLYPNQYGQLSRIPGKPIYAQVAGNPPILGMVQTNDGSGNILVQTAQDLRAYTLDELLGRVISPNIILTPLTDDELMPQAILAQIEPNAQGGGSLRGWISGPDTTSASNTFFGRRLTQLLINESGIVVSSVLTPGGSGAGSGTAADATPGSFTLAPGTYRILISASFYNSAAVGGTFTIGLFNTTAGRFEYFNTTGGSGTQPILATTGRQPASANTNSIVDLKATFIAVSTNQTYQVQHCWTPATTSTGMVRSLTFGGFTDTVTATVNGSAPQTTYTLVQLNKIA